MSGTTYLGFTAAHTWVGRRFLPERYGEACNLLVAHRGKFLLEFRDGWRVATVRGTFRRLKADLATF